jgi:hypothetical protein
MLFVLFVIAGCAYLGTVPGLMGDEGSEGENVYQLLHREGITMVGERSYIGPMIDYARVPLVLIFGYSALALRVLVLLLAVFLFWLAMYVFKYWWGEAGIWAAVGLLFSPVYLLYHRLGWAITLIPFWGILVVALLVSRKKCRWFLVGLAAGVGMANHILFLPVLAGIIAGAIIYCLIEVKICWQGWRKLLLGGLLLAAGFGVGFNTQFVVILSQHEDQGNPAEVAEGVRDRWAGLPDLMPMVVSGSSYMARYTGAELTYKMTLNVTAVIGVLAGIGVALNWRKRSVWAWLVGGIVQLAVLLLLIDRYTLRYFVPTVLILWVLAGLGAGSIFEKILKGRRYSRVGSVVVAAGLVIWVSVGVLGPFLGTGGSTNEFSVGNRTDRAAVMVDVRPLIGCLDGVPNVYSENVHIWNRLQYLSHSNESFAVLGEGEKEAAEWEVKYRLKDSGDCSGAKELCPELKHFCVIETSGM